VTTDAETWAPIIADPLAWQERIDASGLSPNMRGSARFWRTVEARGVKVWYKDGVPEFTEIAFDLGDGIGLLLSTSEGSPYIRYAFCELADEPEAPHA
jgi:hypothetical protein